MLGFISVGADRNLIYIFRLFKNMNEPLFFDWVVCCLLAPKDQVGGMTGHHNFLGLYNFKSNACTLLHLIQAS